MYITDSDVGSSYPGGGEATKGLAVRQLKRYVSWVQTVEECIIQDETESCFLKQGNSFSFMFCIIDFSKFEPEAIRLNLSKRHQSRRHILVIIYVKLTNIGRILTSNRKTIPREVNNYNFYQGEVF